MKVYAAYRFREESKDPVIGQLQTLFQSDLGRQFGRKDLERVAENGGPTVACMVGWFFGKTLRPQSATLEAAGRAMGYQRRWVKMKRNGS